MKNTLQYLCLLSVLAAVNLPASAQPGEKPSCEKVQGLLKNGSPAADVVRATMDSTMTLAEATVFAMVCGGEENRVAIATAGIESAGNLAQAQSVANAVLATAGQTGAVADAVNGAMKVYAEGMPQPYVHEDKYTPYGGGVSPST